MPAKHPTPASADDLLEAFQALVSDTEHLLQQSANLAGDQADVLREQIRNSLGRARSTLEHAEETLQQRGKAALGTTEQYVQSHPWQALGMAAGIGLLLGLLLSRR